MPSLAVTSSSEGQRPIIAATEVCDTRPILFVGDIQGCSGELAQLLEVSGYQTGTHRLIPLGDTINRGPDAPGVLALLRELRAEPIVGNHELYLMQLAAIKHVPSSSDKARSAASQLAGVGQWPQALEWIRQWPNGRSGPGWMAIHAGLHPRLPVEETPPPFLANVRYCTEEGERPSFSDGNLTSDPEGYSPWYAFYRGERTVFFGHWARRGLNLLDHVRGLDSGCVYGGALTGCWWPEGRLVQVPSRQPFRRLTDKAHAPTR